MPSSLRDLPTHHVETMLTVLGYIEENLDKRLLLSKLAKIAHISPYYFHRLFHAHLSISPRKYIQYARLIKSAKLLRYSDLSITDIAFNLGYEEASSFTRAFQQSTGKSPRTYRRETQQRLQLINQSILSPKVAFKPEYVYREEQTVYFRRKLGDYQVTVLEGLRECQNEFCLKKAEFLICYGIALDDPLTIPREECRFDICVMPSSVIKYRGLWGQRKLQGGKYALFIHRGPFFELEKTFTNLFYLWHSSSKDKLRFSGAFCEYLDLPTKTAISANTTVTAKYHVPLLE